MGVDGTMFDGVTNLDPGNSYGTPVLDGLACTSLDFQIQYDDLINRNEDGNEMLFITGNRLYWARVGLNDILRVQSDAGLLSLIHI